MNVFMKDHHEIDAKVYFIQSCKAKPLQCNSYISFQLSVIITREYKWLWQAANVGKCAYTSVGITYYFNYGTGPFLHFKPPSHIIFVYVSCRQRVWLSCVHMFVYINILEFITYYCSKRMQFLLNLQQRHHKIMKTKLY